MKGTVCYALIWALGTEQPSSSPTQAHLKLLLGLSFEASKPPPDPQARRTSHHGLRSCVSPDKLPNPARRQFMCKTQDNHTCLLALLLESEEQMTE